MMFDRIRDIFLFIFLFCDFKPSLDFFFFLSNAMTFICSKTFLGPL